MDDFTFPATAAAAEHAAEPLFLHHHHRLLPFPHFASSPLWFPGDAVKPVVAAVVSRRAVDGMEEQEPASSPSDAGRRAAKGEKGGGGEDEGVAGADGEDKMDMLWENFNEELEALRRAGGSCSKTAAPCGLDELSDTESEAAERGRAGCAPMLRPSSRAGGTGQYCRRSGSWVLLMRIFKRLFVVEKTTMSAAGRHKQARTAE